MYKPFKVVMKIRTLITLLFLTLAVVAGARNYVVLVGIADYPGTKSDLKVSAQDAVTMKAVYDKNGDATTELLTDNEATVENVKVTMGNLFARATSDDAVIKAIAGDNAITLPAGIYFAAGQKLLVR